MTTEIEISRSNCSPAQFLAYVRQQLKKKNAEEMASVTELDYFKTGDNWCFDNSYTDPTTFPVKREKLTSKPYQHQTFILNWDGKRYNEICEFDFWDEKTGTGYYYLLNEQ